ncbi:MAG: DNA methyltransferase, partial [Phototrophicales bacterium]
DTPFEVHFRKFVAEANHAIFDNGYSNKAMRCDALELPVTADLVYIDPPYFNQNGVGIDYRDFYHFLEGIVHYDDWATMIDHNSKHRRLKRQKSEWSSARTVLQSFENLVARHQNSILVVSYRNDGIPTQNEL